MPPNFYEYFYAHAKKMGLLLHYSFSSLSKNAQAKRNDKSCLHEFADCRGVAVVIKKHIQAESAPVHAPKCLPCPTMTVTIVSTHADIFKESRLPFCGRSQRAGGIMEKFFRCLTAKR